MSAATLEPRLGPLDAAVIVIANVIGVPLLARRIVAQFEMSGDKIH